MSKPVFITSDSTCDLTPELLERFNVKTAPLHVLLGEDTYLDGVNFTQEMIFERYAKDKTLPRTAAVSPQEFTDFFTPLVEAGYEGIFLSISSCPGRTRTLSSLPRTCPASIPSTPIS